MAVQISNGGTIPHATNYDDLLTKLVAFATAQGWVLMENSADKVVLKGTGTTGTDAIFVGIQKYVDTTNDAYGWYLNGYTGYSGAAQNFIQQPGAMQQFMPCLPLWNSTIPYWFCVTPRLIKIVAKVSTTYQAAYAGYLLPFATPNQYPYPLVIGGSNFAGSTITNRKPRWSINTADATQFVNPKIDTSTGQVRSPLFVRLPSGVWHNIANAVGSPLQTTGTGVHPFHDTQNIPLKNLRPALSGEYTLQPLYVCTIEGGARTGNILGELDGCKHVAGASNGAENTITVGGRTYLVVQNVFRTDTFEYWAMELA